MTLHPKAGRHYVHVFPKAPFFDEIKGCYHSAAQRMPWMAVDQLEGWNEARPEWRDREAVLVFWGIFPPRPPAGRKAAFVFRYTESVGDPELVTPGQADAMSQFSANAVIPDLVLCGNPVVSDFWSRLARRTATVPVGYEPGFMGTPDWVAEKTFEVAFRGTVVERRAKLMSLVSQRFGKRYLWIKDFGTARKKKLDSCRADLYIGHSQDYAFPGMRLWQGISSSSALITERRNCWPAIAERHYVAIEPADKSGDDRFLEDLGYVIRHYPLEEIARTAHLELAIYTLDYCMEKIVSETKGLGG